MSYYTRYAKPKFTAKSLVLGLAITLGSMASIAWVGNATTRNAAAVTPPDTCFAFGGGTITDYYDNQNNNPGDPACPKDVEGTSGDGEELAATGTSQLHALGIASLLSLISLLVSQRLVSGLRR